MGKKNEVKEEEKKPKGKMKKILIVLLALIVLGASGFGGVYFYMNKNASNVEEPIVEIKVLVADELMVRLADEGGKRYVKTTISISYDKKNSKLGVEIEEKKPEINDKVLFYLMSKEAAQLNATNEVNIKTGLIEEINKLLNNGKIENVYFDSLLVQ